MFRSGKFTTPTPHINASQSIRRILIQINTTQQSNRIRLGKATNIQIVVIM